MNKPILKPCPFCGFTKPGIEEKKVSGRDGFGSVMVFRFRVVCLACGAEGAGYGTEQVRMVEEVKRKAMDSWNRRVYYAEVQ